MRDLNLQNTCRRADARSGIGADETRHLYSQSNFYVVTGDDTVTRAAIWDAIASLCIPICTDGAMALPFPSDVPWRDMAFYHPLSSHEEAQELKRRLFT